MESFENQNYSEGLVDNQQSLSNFPTGVSIESASYMENNNLTESQSNLPASGANDEEYTPKLFSEEKGSQTDEITEDKNNQENFDKEQLFDQDINEEEDFEIPAFFEKQSFNDNFGCMNNLIITGIFIFSVVE